ncbi:MAG: hypothetical protein K9N47_04870 [Prosthecobacter sp.]|uniref:hypothetical protein n=1 Tax=Prosthecobacter sp. TaxID=1965333 RepID=UPI0025DCDA0F|nr:hypothetical protein [Prosthecobacter sp.]MCF7785431.1 hypothetical protein [Prosthecobacter sp.]
MNLREQLRLLLPEILPHDPADSIKGTELIRLVRLRLGEGYSDATLRYHFSILSYDPTSPIAKVDQGQGYYQRQKKTVSGTNGVARQGLFDSEIGESDQCWSRYLRMVAIYERLCLLRSRYPFLLNRNNSGTPSMEGEWDIPDLVVADWDLDTGSDDAPRFDAGMLDLRRHLGGPEVGLAGVQLKLSVAPDTFSSDFFQALSATRWTLQSEIVIAEGLNDEALVDALRSLGHQFGVGISSLGIPLTVLDDLPSAKEIRAMSAAEFEAVHHLLRIQKITLPTSRPTLDWGALNTLRKKHDSVADLVRWLSECLAKRQPEWVGGVVR